VNEPILFGATYSVYVRIVRLALQEKRVPCRLIEVDIFSEDGPPADYLRHHPFARIPTFEHDGFQLYEAGAIGRYVDEAFPGPPLQSSEPKARARMNQIIGILDSYAYRTLVWDIFVERVRAPVNGRAPDEARVAAALPRARTCLQALGDLMGAHPWLAGPTLTLADLHAAPMFAYFHLADEGAKLMADHANIQCWWQAIATRPSMTATRSPLE
jgi:glutathione S-transferase